MDRLFIKLIGLILLFTGLYFFTQNIIFVSSYYSFSRSLPATASVLAMMAGAFTLVFFHTEASKLGWILLGIGIILVFLSGGVIFRSTSLWNLLVAFTALTVGYKLFNQGRINF
ncbi:MAG: hypothetical protein RMY36_000960 [Nostoc sp. SerVER01]|uniref:hypothetical protein n=1 Tax=Nostoc sp. CCY 9925 TaxID=3103865 RepID=UPI002AD97C20|nr:hypothetical protein [Nostoc sp. SerVER01]MDZ8023563.1 hypothetical protein [Nostoc sp. DedQUE11]MDZ8071521.1 hypothetical protein [Nostoc sp. DedQUE01]MDZ8080028.1 hypothetical protein [Nostoc sp. DcaGUA01]MDZ8236481.1 hypothetical protein [Nostoc sp. ChiQUE01a]